MATDLTRHFGGEIAADGGSHVTVQAAGRAFAVPLARVRDAVALGTVAPVPFAPAKVRGLIKAGNAVSTVIDLRAALGLAPGQSSAGEAGLTVEEGGHLYTLIVDVVEGVVPDATALRAEPLDLAKAVGR
jgi:chemotaxis signal transduction protein